MERTAMADVTEFAPLKYDPQQIARQGWGIAVAGPGDDRLIVGFYWKSILNQFKSRESGKPVYEDHQFVKIQHPGETQNIVDRPVRDDDKLRWPRQWAAFQGGKHQVPEGIPITLLFTDRPSISDTLRGYNIHTVEQLANLSGQGILTVGMGAQEWVNAAKKYLEHANKGVDHHRFEMEITNFKAELAKRDRQIAELTALIAQQQRQQPNPQTYDF